MHIKKYLRKLITDNKNNISTTIKVGDYDSAFDGYEALEVRYYNNTLILRMYYEYDWVHGYGKFTKKPAERTITVKRYSFKPEDFYKAYEQLRLRHKLAQSQIGNPDYEEDEDL